MDTMTLVREAPGCVPPAAGLRMPVQSLKAAPRVRRSRSTMRTHVARLLAFGGAALLTAVATWQMTRAVSIGTTSALQWLLVALFALTFAWIAWSATAAIAGALLPPRRGQPTLTLLPRTALVMPVYNEAPSATTAALLAMGEGLCAIGHGERFEIFIVSDTTDPHVWVQETTAFDLLRRRLQGRLKVWYRRRPRNTGRKAGNVKEFVERWGARYDAMVLLDADSVIAPETLVAMSRRMAADAQLGILQSIPMLAGGRGLMARMQQFASRVYGPIVGRGIAAWQGDDGNYWGHNAIIRTRAFAECCGLPTLPGQQPFGGAILSHDFVEAALIRRGGWSVRMDPYLDGSWEDSPPTLLDIATRDRRWAQGNLQHAAVLGARGLAWPNRAHFVNGIAGYLVSPLWCAMIVVGIALAVIAHVTEPVYFTEPFQLFPDWPRFDPVLMVRLFIAAIGVLLLPKALGVARALLDGDLRRGCGGGPRIVASAFAELLVSSVYAPILVLMQTRQVWEILRGKDSGWSTQRRQRGGNPWGEVARRHAAHSVIGMVLVTVLVWTSPDLLWWMAPTVFGLLLAVVLSKISGDLVVGDRVRGLGLFLTPEETAPPVVLVARDAAEAELAPVLARVRLASVLADPEARVRHLAAVFDDQPQERGRPDVPLLTARQKISDAADWADVVGWLDRPEWMAALSSEELTARLARLARVAAT